MHLIAVRPAARTSSKLLGGLWWIFDLCLYLATGVGVDTISCQREITDGGGFRVGLCFVFILGDVLSYFRPDGV